MLTEQEKLWIRQLRADGMTYDRISNITGHASQTVREIAWDVQSPNSSKDAYAAVNEANECRKIFRRIKRAARRYKAAMQTGTMKPCEHCKWRMNKAQRPVCVVCYREVFGR